MDFFDLLAMVGGLALFLYGMNLLSDGLEKLSGGHLERILEKLTNNRLKAVLLGAGVTAVIQSSSAATVMVVGCVNSGIMKLSQAVGVIMGANIGTTITSWLLSLTGIESGNFFLQLAKPTSFSPILAMIGVIFMHTDAERKSAAKAARVRRTNRGEGQPHVRTTSSKSGKKREAGYILVGFSILMFGMDAMSQAMKPLSSVPQFTGLFTMFRNPLLGIAVGALVTAVIQSSSASVGILQALCVTGSISYASAVPIILGQNIGTCVTALMSSVGAGRNAKRASVIHLLFNMIGTAVFMIVFYSLHAVFRFAFMQETAYSAGIALIHTGFNVCTTLLLLPFANLLVKLSFFVIRPDGEEERQAGENELFSKMDERFLNTPSFALEQAHAVTLEMAELAKESLHMASKSLFLYDKRTIQETERMEQTVDRYDDEISSYLTKLSGRNLNEQDSRRLGMLLHSVGDLERISDHAVNLADCAKELKKKDRHFSETAEAELQIYAQAVGDIVDAAISVFRSGNAEAAKQIEPLEEAIDILQKEIKKRHMKRLKKGKCTAQMGFVLSDITNNYERIADHCSNLAISVMQLYDEETYAHEYIDTIPRGKGSAFDKTVQECLKRYELPDKAVKTHN